jgi:hypothetical protein
VPENKSIIKFSLYGSSLGTLLFLVFLTLKILVNAGALHGDFAWLTWFWVFFPLWIGVAVTVGLIVLFFVFVIIISFIMS